MSGEHILVLDDDARLAAITARGLIKRGYRASIATSGEAAIAMAGSTAVDRLLADVFLPGMDGLDTANAIRSFQPDLIVLVMTGEGTPTSRCAWRKPWHALASSERICAYACWRQC